jgi:hypothetical protein
MRFRRPEPQAPVFFRPPKDGSHRRSYNLRQIKTLRESAFLVPKIHEMLQIRIGFEPLTRVPHRFLIFLGYDPRTLGRVSI